MRCIIIASVAAGLFSLGALPAAAASFDGRWFADLPAVQGCAGNAASTLTLLVSDHDVQGRIDNTRGREGVSGTIDDSGFGKITVARQLEGMVQFDGDHFSIQWAGRAGCARHAEGDRALDPAQQAALAAERSRHQVVLADLIRRAGQGEKIDYDRLRAEYVYSAGWDFYDVQLGTLVERADAAAKGGDCPQALSLTALAIRADFIVDAAHAVRAACLKARDPAAAAAEQAIADGLIHSLMDSGDGSAQARAYVVSTLREENDVLANRKIALKARQERVRGGNGHYYDVIQGMTDEKTPVAKTLYFDVGSFMTGRQSKRAAVTTASATIDAPPADGARAPAPAPIFADAPSQQIELTGLFMALCLEVYPDENALADIMSRQGGAPLAAAEFTRLLPIEGKTGRGWTIKGSKGSYVLLVSQGMEPSLAARMPNMKARACTLVTNGPADMDPLPAFRSVKQQHAERKGIPLLPPITNYKLPNSGAMEAQQLGPSSGIFMYSEVVKPETAPLKEFRMEFRPPE